MRINITKNDYQQPVEARQEVVQFICDQMIAGEEIKAYDKYGNSLYIATTYHGFKMITSDDVFPGWDYVRIRGVEMQTAFDELLRAGYYILGLDDEIRGEHSFRCSRKPYYKGIKCTAKFLGIFID